LKKAGPKKGRGKVALGEKRREDRRANDYTGTASQGKKR